MKTISNFLCISLMIAYVWAVPIALDGSTVTPSNIDFIPINICPIPMCLAVELPCDDIRTSYVIVNGKRCPMCQYCHSKTTRKPKYPIRCSTIRPTYKRVA